MTEDEAKKKWCPKARATNDAFKSTTSVNKYLNGEIMRGTECIASDCMMWRVSTKASPGNIRDDLGYCGLAGKP